MNILVDNPKDITSFLSFSYRRIDFFTKCIAFLHLVFFSLFLLKNHYDTHNFLQNVTKLKKNARDINRQCPICMETITDEVKLICYHSFCARCIFDISNSNYNVIRCPCCRKNSILYIIRFKPNTTNKFFYKFFKIQNKNTLKTFQTCACLCYNNFREKSKNMSFPRRRCLMLDFIIDLIIWFLPKIEEKDILIMTGIIVFYMTLNILLMISLYLLTRRRLEMERFNVFINQ